MIYINMKRRAEGMELEALGHAGHGAIGHDIVCAGVSAILYGLAAYLEGLCDKNPTGCLTRTEGAGRLYLRIGDSEEAEIAFAVAAAGLALITRAFPEAVCFRPSTDCPTMTKEELHGRHDE